MTTAPKLDPDYARSFSDRIWDSEILPALEEYIRIPNKSPAFDPKWSEHGHMQRAVDFIVAWCKKQPIAGLTVEVHKLEGRTPVILMELPGTGPGNDTVLLYGHLDKQPEMSGWREGLSPWTPVREGDRLYGRGGADDGYSSFASIAALRMLTEQKVPHARCVVLIEAAEESGSPDVPAYVEALAARIGKPSLVVCLDSGCANYDQLWSTTSLRGGVWGTLRVDILTEGVHSGAAGGIVPDSFRIIRRILSRIEDEKTGQVLLDALHVEIPPARRAQAHASAEILKDEVHKSFPWIRAPVRATSRSASFLLDRTWRPQLAVTGAEGLPEPALAGNVLRPFTAVKLAMRIPPRLYPRRPRAPSKTPSRRTRRTARRSSSRARPTPPGGTPPPPPPGSTPRRRRPHARSSASPR